MPMPPPVKFLLDIQALQGSINQERGIPRYVRNLSAILESESGRVAAFLLNPELPSPDRLPPEIRQSGKIFWNTRRRIDALLAPEESYCYLVMSPFGIHQVTPAFFPAHMNRPNVVSAVILYDVIPSRRADRYLPSHAASNLFNQRLRLLKTCGRILCISEYTRADARSLLNVPPEQIVSIGCGVENRFNREPVPPDALNGSVRTFLDSANPFIMTVSGDDPRKNLVGLLRAFRGVSSRFPGQYDLAVAGNIPPETRSDYLNQAGVSPELRPHIHFLSKVADSELKILYQRAALFVFPSVMEGFGLPPAEAMACGCPALVSNRTSLPEVLPWEPAQFDPENASELSAKIIRCLTDADFRDELIQQGEKAVSLHRWDRVATRVVHAVQDLQKTRPPPSSPPPMRKRIAWIGVFPPVKSGIADYNARVLQALTSSADVDVFLPSGDVYRAAEIPDTCRRYLIHSFGRSFSHASYDLVIYTVGNSGNDVPVMKVMRKYPGVVWLHDVRLHGLRLSERLQEKGGARLGEEMRKLLRDIHPECTAVETASESDLRSAEWCAEQGLCLTRGLLDKARAVIVHSEHAADLLRRDHPNPRPELLVWPLAASPQIDLVTDPALPPRGICTFGQMGPAKSPETHARMFRELMCRFPACRFAFVGDLPEPHRREIAAQLQQHGHGPEDIHVTGRVTREVYLEWLKKTDLAIFYRAHSNGETSAAANDCLAAGIPVVSNLPSHAEYPEDSLVALPPDISASAMTETVATLISDPEHRTRLQNGALKWAQTHTHPHIAHAVLDLCHQLPLREPFTIAETN